MLDISKFADIVNASNEEYAKRLENLAAFSKAESDSIRCVMREAGFKINDDEGLPHFDHSPEKFGSLPVFMGLEFGGLLFNQDDDYPDRIDVRYICPHCGGRIILSSNQVQMGRELTVLDRQETLGRITFGGHQCGGIKNTYAKLKDAHAEELDALAQVFSATGSSKLEALHDLEIIQTKVRHMENDALLEAIETTWNR